MTTQNQTQEQAIFPEKDNMELWGKLFVTDRKEVKPITGKSYKGDSPKPYYLIQKATEIFGPCGIGWGYRIVDHGFNEHTVTELLGNPAQQVQRTLINHWCLVEFWYKWGGIKSEPIQQFGGTTAAYKTTTGKIQFDEDVTKKSVTDALVKCMSTIGFAGDIFSGRWDDSKYHQEQEERQNNQQNNQQRQNNQQSNQNQQAQQQANVLVHASQLSPEDQKTACISSLAKIDKATTKAQVNKIYAFWSGVPNHQETIEKACRAKADREGWTDQGANQP